MHLLLWAILLPVVTHAVRHLYLVESDHHGVPRKRYISTRRYRQLRRDVPTETVIHSPRRGILTKENFYVNANNLNEMEAKMYESILMQGKTAVSEIDSFFVTPPPRRTTMTPKTMDVLPELAAKATAHAAEPIKEAELLLVSEGSIRDEENEIKQELKGRRKDLKLVTIPPRPTTTPAPFKFNSAKRQISPANHTGVEFSRSKWQNEPAGPAVRFPAQPWQIPPIAPPTTPQPFLALFQPQATQQPQNPFAPPTNATSTQNFLPIAVAPPPFSLPSPNLRVGSFARNAPLQPIPLPDQFPNEAPPTNFVNPDPIPFGKKAPAPIDFSIDSQPIVRKPDEFQPQKKNPFAKTFVASNLDQDSTQKLRNFASAHPNMVNSVQPAITTRVATQVLPKSPLAQQPGPNGQLVNFVPEKPITATTNRRAYVPLMNPNQKLDLCCRKQRVSPFCQSFCNFDTFNDRTLVTAFVTNQCPGPQLGQAYDCASSKADHSACCERAGLASFQGGKCMSFCKTHLTTPANVLDYFVCLQVFESIKGCYREYQLTNPNVFGD